jgi:hypothetical protein
MVVMSFISVTIYHPPEHSGAGFLRFGGYVVALTVVGMGLLYLKKWAAAIFSGLTLYLAFWMVKGAIHKVPGQWNRIGFLFALLLIIPSILTAKHWHSLVWWHKRDDPSRARTES